MTVSDWRCASLSGALARWQVQWQSLWWVELLWWTWGAPCKDYHIDEHLLLEMIVYGRDAGW